MANIFKPMLAANDRIVTPEDLQQLQYPLWGTPKKDGIRARVVWDKKHGHHMLSRTNKPIPNCFVEEWCKENEVPEGCDGELVVQGRFGDEDFNECQSKFMSTYSVPFEWTYYVFDDWSDTELNYIARVASCSHLKQSGIPYIDVLCPKKLKNPDDVLEYETVQVDLNGHEGIILRSNSRYKQGRTTFREGLMLKMKRFQDKEALIIGFEERMHNANKGKRNEVGAFKRSKHKANLHRTGMLGAFWLRDIETGVEFKCSGFTDAFARKVWENQHHYYNKLCTYCKPLHGEKNKPRQPKFKGIRDERDL